MQRLRKGRGHCDDDAGTWPLLLARKAGVSLEEARSPASGRWWPGTDLNTGLVGLHRGEQVIGGHSLRQRRSFRGTSAEVVGQNLWGFVRFPF